MCAIVGVVGCLLVGAPGWAVGFGALGLVALVDLAVVVHRIRQGPHFQPGRSIPPYRPAEGSQAPTGTSTHAPPPMAIRRRWYLSLMAVCLGLFVLAWTWVRLYSTGLAVAMTVVASVIPPLAVIVANAGSPLGRQRDR